MPFKFWKREKPGKEKGEAAKQPKGSAAKVEPAIPDEPAAARLPAPSAAEAKPSQAPEPSASAPADLEGVVAEVHAGLVDLGLTIPGTKGVFAKRVAEFPGGAAEFVRLYHDKPFRAGTAILAGWLGFLVPADFEPSKLLSDANLRLSSFKLAVQMSDLTWLDEELGLRKARLRLGDEEKVVRFRDARDFVKGVNELLEPKKIAFLELETWSSDDAFLLVRDPKWDKLAATSLVVVKALQTAVGGECGECGAPVGTNWHDCVSCGAVFSME